MKKRLIKTVLTVMFLAMMLGSCSKPILCPWSYKYTPKHQKKFAKKSREYQQCPVDQQNMGRYKYGN